MNEVPIALTIECHANQIIQVLSSKNNLKFESLKTNCHLTIGLLMMRGAIEVFACACVPVGEDVGTEERVHGHAGDMGSLLAELVVERRLHVKHALRKRPEALLIARHVILHLPKLDCKETANRSSFI
jgi:hypothetical protein